MNIFLVEDERWALAELTELFKRYEPQHEIFPFESGDEALSAASVIHPHLVITDITMPGMDGLELIEKLYQLDPSIKSLIISVHDQFEYARQGMKFGVIDYLLKPVKKDALFAAVDKAIQKIENDKKQKEDLSNWSITRMILTPFIPRNAISDRVNARVYCMVLLMHEHDPECDVWKEAITPHDIKRTFAGEHDHEDEIYCVDLDYENKAVLIPLAHATITEGLKSKLMQFYRHLQQLSSCIHMGYMVKSGTDQLFNTFSRLKRQMEEQMIFGMSTFLPPETVGHDIDISGIWDKVRVLETQYKKGDILKGQTTLKQLLEELRLRRITKRQLKMFVSDMLYSLKYNLMISKAGPVNLNHMQEDTLNLDRLYSYDELFEWLNEQIVGLFGGHESQGGNPKELVPVLIRWVHTHYQDNLSLQQFAAEHHVSLGYLSRIFKAQTGCTFSEYVTRYRINKAKELLIGGAGRLHEVSNMVGYEDPKHFSALFKKLVGETPVAFCRKRKITPSNK